jgi:hypothetical protein
MTNTAIRADQQRRTHRRNQILGDLAAIVVMGGSAMAVAVVASGGTPAAGALVRTGETNSMGMPVIETPGTSSGTVTAAAITAEPASWELGTVPLNMAVRPTWTIRNTGTDVVTIGEPDAQIHQGCCPGPFTFAGPTTLQPGGQTSFNFELSMHPGMDGPHDITVHVPLTHADGATDMINVDVTGNFHD